jgi:hypothetical protein
VELDLLIEQTFEVRARFELAAGRMADAWLGARGLQVSREDFRIAREFLERDGWSVDELPGVRVRLGCREIVPVVMTREAAVMVALRRLAVPSGARKNALLRMPPPRRPGRRLVIAAEPFVARSPAILPRDVSRSARSDEAACRVELPA